jgi:hypothetical protein
VLTHSTAPPLCSSLARQSELIVNMYGHWFCEFWRSGFNIFDFFVVAVGVILMLAPIVSPGIDLSRLGMLKMLRAFRVFRLFKRIKAFRRILISLFRSIPGVTNAFLMCATAHGPAERLPASSHRPSPSAPYLMSAFAP